MGSLAEEKQMNQTPNAQLSGVRRSLGEDGASNAQFSTAGATSNVGHRRSNVPWRILDFIVAALFVFAGLSKIFELDHLLADLRQFHFGQAFADLRQLALAGPVEFANDIDNFKILPWPISVAFAFYLPWLEIFCGFGVAVRACYRGALSILIALMLVFTLAIFAAKIRGLDISCGCFGHASQHWSFPAHLLTNFAILAALLVLFFKAASQNRLQNNV
jgi:putative oxidoreductase